MRALLSYILTRILLTIPMILILLTLVFFIIRVMPGDPVKSMLGAHAPKETMDEIRHQLGLDKPIIDFSTNNQFVDYMSALLHGDFGMSLWYKVPVTKKIAQYFPATLELTIFALLFAVGLGVATGAFAAHKRKSAADYAIRLFGITTYSIPVFWLGLMLQMFLGVGIGWFPSWFPIAGRIGARISPNVVTGLYVAGRDYHPQFRTGDKRAVAPGAAGHRAGPYPLRDLYQAHPGQYARCPQAGLRPGGQCTGHPQTEGRL